MPAARPGDPDRPGAGSRAAGGFTRRSPAVVALAAVVAALAIAVPAGATAQSTEALRVYLDFRTDDPACIVERELVERVEERVGRRVFTTEDRAELVIDGHVGGREGSYSAELALRTPDGVDLGVRDLEGELDAPCEDLDEQLSLVVALVVESPATRQAIEEAAKPWHGSVALAFRTTLGPQPEIAFGGGVDVTLVPPGFIPLTLELTVYAPTEAPATTRVGGVRLIGAEGALLGCPRPLDGATGHVDLCLGVRAGMLVASGFGFDQDDSAVRPTVAPIAQARGALHVGPVEVGLTVAGGVEVIRDRFYVARPDGSPEVLHRPSLAFGRADVWVGIRF